MEIKNLFNNVNLIDCTLRDGGHLNNWKFSKEFASRVYSAIAECGLYCIEVGYVSSKGTFPDAGIWRFSHEEDIRSIVPPGYHTKVAVMGDIGKIDLDSFIDKEDSIIDLVRLAFYPGHIYEALELGEQVMNKGYEISLNLMAITHYSQKELEEIVSLVYNSRIENIFVSDSFGSLLPNQVGDLVRLFKKGTGKEIGFHAHNNLELAFANCIRAVESGASFIDTTVYGMGRGAGNLPLEVILSYINHHENGHVNMIPLLELIEDEFIELKDEMKWGYNLEYVLSGILKCHPTYASKLIRDNKLKIREIWPILIGISKEKTIEFDKKLLDKMLSKKVLPSVGSGLGHEAVDFASIASTHVSLESPVYLERHKGRDFLILAQGPSLKRNIKRILAFVKENNLIVLGPNYLEGLITPDYHAFSNFKRFSRYIDFVSPESKLLLGSYFSNEVVRKYTNREFERIPYVDDPSAEFDIKNGIIQTNCGTVSVLLIAVAIVMGARKIYIAGLDGYKSVDGNATHFYDEKEMQKGRELETLHNICTRYLGEIKQYQLLHGMEPFKVITPTSYSKHYEKIKGF